MSPEDSIAITGLRANAFHGVLERERRTGQIFVIDLVVNIDAAKAAASDNLADTVDYGLLSSEVVAAVESDPVNLIETLAERVANVALAHRAVTRVTVTIHKPNAPIDVPFDDVSVSIVRDAR